MDATEYAVLAEGLRKTYGTTVALDHFDLAVRTGSVCGLLGPNGAGKTTAVRILATLLHADGGRAAVAGFDVGTAPVEVRRRIGLVGQHPAVDEMLTGAQNLVMFGRLYHLDGRTARRRAGELLDRFGLTDAADRRVQKYSGGMRRRLDLAVGLILAPSVLLLDEPTTGLDPRGRNEVWHAVRALVAGGTSVLLTTQYLDEADQLADHIAVVDAGRVIANGSPDELKTRIGGDHLDIVLHRADDLPAATAIVAAATGSEPLVDVDQASISAPVHDRVRVLSDVVTALHERDVEVRDVNLRRPTLDEVFLTLTADADSERSGMAA